MSHPSALIALPTVHRNCCCPWAHGQLGIQLSAHLLCTNKCPERLLVPLPCVMQFLPANWLWGMLQNCLKMDLILRQRLCEQRPWDMAALNAEILFCPANVLSILFCIVHPGEAWTERRQYEEYSRMGWVRSDPIYTHTPNPSSIMVWSKRLEEQALKHAFFHSRFVIRTVTEKGLTNQCRLKWEKINKKL